MPAEWPAGSERWDAGEPSGEADQARRRAEAAAAAEHRIADRFARLHGTTAALSAALTPRDVAAVLALRGAALPGTASCAVAFLAEDGATLRLAALRGVAPAQGRGVEGERVDAPALVARLRERRPQFIADRAARGRDEAAREAAAAWGFRDEVVRAAAELPLLAGERILGAVGLAFAAPRELDEEERAFLEAFADQGAVALDRARLYEAERAARLEAQHAEEAARRAVELQERLVGVVGHDLRTPLSAIRMAAGLLLQRGGLDDAQARTLARLSASAARMTGIIRDLLDFTRIRREGTIPVQPGPTDLAEIVCRAVTELAAAYPGREIAVDVPDAAPVEGDPERLTQVLSNLIGNALQHSPQAAPVEVLLRAEAGAFSLEVHNQGPPIRPELLPDIFEPFRRGVLHRADPSGSIGLGLFIVRELVRAHGGSVEVRSTAAEGTTFTVRFPIPGAETVPTGHPTPDG
jgi:signal transduction histidine kinase